jgi:Ni/Co efflux regulator RcnB
MKNLLFAGVAGLTMLVSAPAVAASDSFAGEVDASKIVDLGGVFEGRRGGGGGGHGPRVMPMPGGHGPVVMPGGHGPRPIMHGQGHYRMPFRGYTLPTYWFQPSFRVVNFARYGLYVPQAGFGWSRYFNDAVLINGQGLVHDSVRNVPWDQREFNNGRDIAQPEFGPALATDRDIMFDDDGVYSDDRFDEPAPMANHSQQPNHTANNGGYPAQEQVFQSRYGFERYEQCLRNRGVAGGLIGGVVGAVIGNRVAGRGDRLAGSLFGGGAGALIGLTIEKATNKCKKYLPRDDRYYYNNGGHQQGGHSQGGHAPAPAPQPYPHHQGGYVYNGWYYPAPVITTVTVTPAVTTTTTVTEEVYYESVPVKRKAVRKWKPRAKPKPRCHCH